MPAFLYRYDKDAGGARLLHRAQALAQKADGEVVASTTRVGGGVLPLLELSGPAVALSFHGNPQRLASALRQGDPPLLTQIHDGRVIVDPRTLPDNALSAAASAVRHVTAALMGHKPGAATDA